MKPPSPAAAPLYAFAERYGCARSASSITADSRTLCNCISTAFSTYAFPSGFKNTRLSFIFSKLLMGITLRLRIWLIYNNILSSTEKAIFFMPRMSIIDVSSLQALLGHGQSLYIYICMSSCDKRYPASCKNVTVDHLHRAKQHHSIHI